MNYSKYLVYILTAILAGCGTKNNETTSQDTISVKDSVGSLTENVPDEPSLKKYDIRSGIISFEILGKEPGSSKLVYFDEYGNKEVSYIYSRNKLSEKWINGNDGSFYTLNYENMTGAKRNASRPGTEERFDIEEMPEDMQKENKVTRLEDNIFATKLCKVYSLESGGIKTTKAGWGHIILMLSTEVADFKFRTIAKTLEENAAIPDSVYNIPADFTIKEF